MKASTLKSLGVFSISLFTAFSAVYIYSPVIGSHAESDTADIKLEVGEVISLTLDKNNLALQTDVNSFVSGTIAASVSTNSQYGYTLTFEDEDASTSMTHTNPSVNAAISSNFDNTKTSSTMADNTWGFSLDATEYSKIPANGASVTLKTTSTPSAIVSDTTTITVGAKVGNITAGTYTDSLLFSAYTNGAPECNDFFCITNMQEMTSSICEGTTTPLATATNIDWDGSHAGDRNYIPRTTLTDTRDNNTYLVSKFADGACWMSQGLELELSTSRPLTSADTDLNSKSSWTPGRNTTTDPSYFESPSFSTYSSDPSIPHRANSFRLANTTYLRNGTEVSSTPSTNDGKSEWEKVGIYYDQDAATAESNAPIFENFSELNDSLSKTAPDSICPKGWRLPTGAYDNNEDDINRYQEAYSYSVIEGMDTLFNEYLSFTATDIKYNYNSQLSLTDKQSSYYQTSVVTDSYYQSGLALYINSSDWGKYIDTAGWDSTYRHDGYQVRCIAR